MAAQRYLYDDSVHVTCQEGIQVACNQFHPSGAAEILARHGDQFTPSGCNVQTPSSVKWHPIRTASLLVILVAFVVIASGSENVYVQVRVCYVWSTFPSTFITDGTVANPTREQLGLVHQGLQNSSRTTNDQ